MSNAYEWATSTADHGLRIAAVVALFGTPLVVLAIHHGHHLWLIALSFGLVILVSLGEGTFRTYKEVLDQVPERAEVGPFSSFHVGRIWGFPAQGQGDEHMIALDLRLTNRQPDHKVNLDADLMWQLTFRGVATGRPFGILHDFTTEHRDRLTLPADIEPESTISGLLTFRDTPGLIFAVNDSYQVFRVTKHARVFLRMTDHVTGEIHEHPIEVPWFDPNPDDTTTSEDSA